MVGVLVLWNLLANVVVPDAGVVVLNLGATAVLVAIARRGGVGWDLLGMRRDMLGRGVRVGAVAAAVVVLAVWVVSAVPGSDDWFADRRMAGVGTAAMAREVLVRIPLGTALAEEVAFRGVVVGVWLAHAGPRRAIAVSSALFGLWHVLPGLDAAASSTALATGGVATAAAVAGQVLVTGVAGVALAWLRFRAASVVAPVLAHWGLNAAGYVAAWATVAAGTG